MNISVRKATALDKTTACYVEGRSTPNLRYLERMWDEFTSDPNQPLFIAEVDGQMAGVGKFTVLYDGSAWLETLRVDPDFQRKGVGKAIYQSYMKQAEILGVPAVSMYTGVRNDASAGLARLYGFKLAGQYSGADLDVGTKQSTSDIANFSPVAADDAVNLLKPLASKWENFMILNRTFYHMNEHLYRALAVQGFVYYDAESDSVIVLGARFMPERGLHIGLYSGDTKKCLDFALNKACEAGVGKISIMFPPALSTVKEQLVAYGYEMQKSDCIVMECNRK